uniref:Uncharacterized protein n=1 Tax=Utricularia reniformis TaxID=192314 RepID=A0A1Y0B1K7_9LAMI|nr:hypothetical protein AEK19_MT1117 [Utricularia reniformis]ART31335.1 hypothetical protein AEK19_MT1117 [Utricularia reniformis]
MITCYSSRKARLLLFESNGTKRPCAFKPSILHSAVDRLRVRVVR